MFLNVGGLAVRNKFCVDLFINWNKSRDMSVRAQKRERRVVCCMELAIELLTTFKRDDYVALHQFGSMAVLDWFINI